MPRNEAVCTSILNGLVERAWESADEGLGMALPLTHKRLWACLFHFLFLGTSFLLGKMESLEPTTRPPRWFPLLPLCGYFCAHSNSPGFFKERMNNSWWFLCLKSGESVSPQSAYLLTWPSLSHTYSPRQSWICSEVSRRVPQGHIYKQLPKSGKMAKQALQEKFCIPDNLILNNGPHEGV